MPKGFSSSVDRLAGALCLWFLIGSGQVAGQPPDSPEVAASTFDLIAPLRSDRALGYFIADARLAEAVTGSDAELCTWALDDWIRHSDGRLEVVPASESDALIRVYFVSPGFNRYGEMRPILVGGRRGAEVFVRTETESLGADIAGAAEDDALMRDTIVYLTCLHELGHALGMIHTGEFADVMVFFGFGGDIPAFFSRYRSRIEVREDIASQSGLSAGDIAQLLSAYPED